MLDELERLEAAATRGPWVAVPTTWKSSTSDYTLTACGIEQSEAVYGAEAQAISYATNTGQIDPADAALIAAARNALPALLRVARAAKEAADDLEAELRGRYTGILDWPSMRERFERDMQAVEAVRAALTALEGGDQP